MYVQQQPVYVQQQPVTQTVVTKSGSGDAFRSAIPDLPMILAVLLCVLNFLFPGLGTILAGFFVLCVGNPGQDFAGRFGALCINFFVGVLQLLLAVFVVGWVWSIVWGYAFLAQSGSTGQETVVTTQQIQPMVQPIVTVQQPMVAVQQPVIAMQQPVVAMQQPVVAMQQPVVAM